MRRIREAARTADRGDRTADRGDRTADRGDRTPTKARETVGAPSVERADAADRAFLAMDTGPVPEQFGVVLELSRLDGLDLARVRALLAGRVGSLPRLKQRLLRTPWGCGGPIWVDDTSFDIRAHVQQVACRPTGDERALLDTALAVVMEPLPADRPLWSARLVTGLEGGRSALVVTLHHVLADGVGGLAVLASLVDPLGDASVDAPDPTTGGAHRLAETFPRPVPSRRRLAQDAWSARLRALRGVRSSWRQLRMSFGAGGGFHPPRAGDCSLLQPSGARRSVAVVRVGREALRRTAHDHEATTNDAVLVAVAGALHRLLERRGEELETVVLTVPVSGRVQEGGAGLGNLVSPILVPVPTSGDPVARLRVVGREVRARKGAATGPAPIAVLGWLFRPLAALGGYRWYMNHQRRFHSLVSHLRGPSEPLRFGGAEIVSATPIAVGSGGNATVYFAVLSYRDTLTVTAIVDADRVPDLDVLASGLEAELQQLAAGVG